MKVGQTFLSVLGWTTQTPGTCREYLSYQNRGSDPLVCAENPGDEVGTTAR